MSPGSSEGTATSGSHDEPVTRFDPDAFEHIPATAASTYTKLAETYGQRYYDAVAAEAAGHATGAADRVLDAGTGPGILPVKLAQRTATVPIDAFDYTRRLVETGRDRIERHRLADRVSCLVADIYDLPFHDATYSFVTCTGVLHGLDEPAAALTELYRVLKPQGTVWAFDPAILTYDDPDAAELNSHEREILAAYRASEGPSSFEPADAERMIAATPFDRCDITEGPDGDSRLYLYKTP